MNTTNRVLNKEMEKINKEEKSRQAFYDEFKGSLKHFLKTFL